MKLISVLAVALSLSGCATCQHHPVACGLVGAVVVTSVGLTVNHYQDSGNSPRVNRPSFCGSTGISCQ
jgi:hypothetical protein